MVIIIASLVIIALFWYLGIDPSVLMQGAGPAAITLVIALLAALFSSIHVATALGIAGLAITYLFVDRNIFPEMGELAWITTNNFVFVAIPLFILMGEILLRSGLIHRLYAGLAPLLRFLPGGVIHTNVAAAALFASACGSSVATAATVGTVSLPYFKKGEYNERIVVGSLAAGGTLGILIPPSISIIIYALITKNSVGRLFLAGVVPGIVLVLLFGIIIIVWSIFSKELNNSTLERRSMRRQAMDLLWCAPLAGIIVAVVGSIYAGLATPTEAAALGVIASLIVSMLSKTLNWQTLTEAVESTARTTSMVVLILIFATIFQFMVNTLGLATSLASAITSLKLSPYGVLAIIVVFYMVAGTFLEDIALMVTTLPVIYPIIQAVQQAHPEMRSFDGVTFGIIFIVLIQMAIISPPDGLNLYVIQGLRKGHISDVYIGVLPFFGAMAVLIVLIVLFPQLALALPDWAYSYGK